MQRIRLFERGEVLPLQILDERQLDDLPVVHIANDDRELLQADLDRSLIPPLAGDDLIPAALHPERLSAR